MPELVQGGRLKIDCVRTRGFEPHSRHTGSTVREHGIPLWRNRIAHLPSKQGVVGSSPTKGIGEHGMGSTVWEHGMGSTAWGVRHGEYGMGSTVWGVRYGSTAWGARYGEHGKLILSNDSSVGRAVDCRSIGRVFNSPSLDSYNRFRSLIGYGQF